MKEIFERRSIRKYKKEIISFFIFLIQLQCMKIAEFL